MTTDHTPPTDRAAIRAEAFRDAANGAYLNVHSAAVEGVRRWLLALADGELRRLADEAQPGKQVVPCVRPEPHVPHLHSGLRKGVAVHGRCPGVPTPKAQQEGTQR